MRLILQKLFLCIWFIVFSVFTEAQASSNSCSANCSGGSCEICVGNCNEVKHGPLDFRSAANGFGYVIVAPPGARASAAAETRIAVGELLVSRDIYEDAYPDLRLLFEQLSYALAVGDDAMLLGTHAELSAQLFGARGESSEAFGGIRVGAIGDAAMKTSGSGGVLCGCSADGTPVCREL